MQHVIRWVLSACLMIGVGSALIERTYEMAKAAVHAHQHDQMSYSKFTKTLLNEPVTSKEKRRTR